MKLLLVVLACLLLISLVYAQDPTPHTVEILTARGNSVFPISFFNSDEAQTYYASLENSSPAARLNLNSTYVEENDFGSFNLMIGNEEIPKGVYFDNLIISTGSEIFQQIPVVIGLESRISELDYDTSIDFDSESDISIISGETILSPTINVYKLNYNNQGPNGVVIGFWIYSIDGELLSYSEEVVSVTTQASFEHFFNLGVEHPDEVLIVASARRENSFGLDLYQLSMDNLLFSPPLDSGFVPRIYLGIFIFLLSSIILISYLWYNRSVKQTKNWMGELEYIKKTQFSDAAKALRKLENQRSVLQRAYSSRFISKSSYESAMGEIDRLSSQLKKRL